MRSLYWRSGRKVAKPYSVAESRKRRDWSEFAAVHLLLCTCSSSVFSCALATTTLPQLLRVALLGASNPNTDVQAGGIGHRHQEDAIWEGLQPAPNHDMH